MKEFCVYGPDGRGGMACHIVRAEDAEQAAEIAFVNQALAVILKVVPFVRSQDGGPSLAEGALV